MRLSRLRGWVLKTYRRATRLSTGKCSRSSATRLHCAPYWKPAQKWTLSTMYAQRCTTAAPVEQAHLLIGFLECMLLLGFTAPLPACISLRCAVRTWNGSIRGKRILCWYQGLSSASSLLKLTVIG